MATHRGRCHWQVVRDVAAMATKPFVVSHTGVQGTCPSNRNLSDELLHAIADKGGIVGIAFFPEVRPVAPSRQPCTVWPCVPHVVALCSAGGMRVDSR